MRSLITFTICGVKLDLHNIVSMHDSLSSKTIHNGIVGRILILDLVVPDRITDKPIHRFAVNP